LDILKEISKLDMASSWDSPIERQSQVTSGKQPNPATLPSRIQPIPSFLMLGGVPLNHALLAPGGGAT
jgi:hypothetical protein